jgi:ketosteroid isomerase-like protein
MKNLFYIFIAASFTIFFSCINEPKVNLNAELQALRQADITWSEAATAKDVDRYVDFYDNDISLIDPSGQINRGKASLQEIVNEAFSTPGYFLTWQVENAFVAKAGDLGYTNGSWNKQITSENGEQLKTHGSYLIIWKKQTDGSWKAIVDGFWKAQ